jgi:hypothetical protein
VKRDAAFTAFFICLLAAADLVMLFVDCARQSVCVRLLID